ncbi:MAG: hypothetical protein ABIF19_02440 [Planctomycetota bacterium]
MKLNYNYLRQQKRLIPLALLGISAAFAALILIKTTSFFVASARAETLVRRAASQTKPNAEAMKECEARSLAIADDLKKSNLFSPPPPEQHPVSSVLGILGDEVLIEDKWYKVGDRVGEARIVAIEASQVRIEWQGREKVFAPIDGTTEPASDGSRRLRRDTSAVARSSKSSNRLAEMVLIGQAGKLSKEQAATTDKKAEKQRLAAEKKEFQKLSKNDTKNIQTERSKVPAEKKKIQSDNKRKANEKAAEKKAGNSAQKKQRQR